MDTYRVKISSLDHFGRGIARINNKIIFVPYAIDNEVVDVLITCDKKKFMEGKIVDIILKSKDRVDPICPYFGICGGCDIMHMSYYKQLDFKYEKVKNIMNKYASLDCVNRIVPSLNIYNYRNKVTFKYNGKVGYNKKKSFEIVNIDNCDLLDIHINRLIETLNTLKVNKEVMVRYFKEELIKIDDKVINDKTIVAELNDKKYYVSADSFFQVNTNTAIKLYEKVKEYADLSKEDNVLDLYCGTGSIGIYLADHCKSVLGIEINEDAIKDANKNKELNNLNNITFKCGDVGKLLSKNNFKPNLLIVDPPRAGLDSLAMSNVMDISAPRVIYVSCDPMTLARDLNILKDKYDILSITPFDMFPQTYHVECVCVMKLR